MVKAGGPCQGPGKLPNTVCGETEISDSCSWRVGCKFKPEYQGKACCTKRPCRIYLGVIQDPKAVASQPAATATATAAPPTAPPAAPPVAPTPPTLLLLPPPLFSPNPLQPSPLARPLIAAAAAPIAAAPVAAQSHVGMPMTELLETMQKYPKLKPIVHDITQRNDLSPALKMQAIQNAVRGEAPPPPPPPPPPWLGDATLHLGLPYGLIKPPIPPPILLPSTAATVAATIAGVPPASATSAAAVAAVLSPAVCSEVDMDSQYRFVYDDEDPGNDLFMELTELLDSPNPSLPAARESLRVAHEKYVAQRRSNERRWKGTLEHIEKLRQRCVTAETQVKCQAIRLGGPAALQSINWPAALQLIR